MMNLEPVQRRDYLYVAFFALLLYAIVLAVGGPLTMHEGVLSQTTKAMLGNHDWLVPRHGDAPWLERPPLPQWILCALCSVIGHCDQEWHMRMGSALAGVITVLLTVWLSGRLFGRGVGILSGLALATMYNFVRYSTLAEADIFLAPIVSGALCVFAYIEVPWGKPSDVPEAAVEKNVGSRPESRNFFGARSWWVLLFFVLLGMTNLAKGLIFGTVLAVVPIVLYQLWNDRTRTMMIFLALFAWAHVAKLLGLGSAISMGPAALYLLWNIGCFTRYVWLWGWLAFAAVALPWPLLVYQQYPDALEVWKFDLVGRLNENYLGEPIWYYFECLTWVPQPWSIAAFLGLGVTFRKVWHEGSLAHRFIWCWAWMPILVFTLAQGKHHHYMLHFLAPWAILAAQGTIWLWQKGAERWQLHRPALALGSGFACLFVLYAAGFTYKGAYLNRSLNDTAFLLEARRRVPLDQPLMINSPDEALEGLRMQFYIGDSVYFLHNLSFVRDSRVNASDIYVVTRGNCQSELTKYGHPEPILVSKATRREKSPADRWTLFRLHLRADLERRSAAVRITPMQAMYREPGPDLDKK